MMLCRTFIASIGAFLIAGIVGTVQAASPAFETTLGVNHHFTQEAGQDARDIEETRTAGFRVIRYDMTWAAVEHQKGQYDFQTFDRLTEQMLGKGIRPLFILDYGNPLYGDALAVRTEEARMAFARFAAAAEERYRGKGVIWELWNEPNDEVFWLPHPDVSEYMKLVIGTAEAMRTADPDATIIAPGTAHIDFSFLENCFKLGLLSLVDAVSVHPYREGPPETVLDDYGRLRQLIRKYLPPDKSMPLVVSEWGYLARSAGKAEQLQARNLSRMFLVNAYAGIDFTIWYDFRNDPGEQRDSNYGWLRQDGTDKPVLEAARNLGRQLSGRRFAGRLASRATDFLLEFVDAQNKPCVVAWTTGREHAVHVEGQGAVRLTQSPQYLKCRLQGPE